MKQSMKQNLVSYFSGLLFALGLGVAGMTLPERILSFLDVLGSWNSALLFVMGTAVIVNGLVYFFIRKKDKPLLAESWSLPSNKSIDRKLVIGSLLFGLGWGLAGYCPGPAFVSLVTLRGPVLAFVASMLAGMFLFKKFAE